ncbi:MAG: hypothetical protein IID09_03270 [Candidatus Hydrogenedentes bacterium]|nr:hypothetical protein [Candidatus Hydrogenedentota bacterium]
MIAPVPLHPAHGPAATPSQASSAARSGDFASVLDRALGQDRAVRFSAHAMQRLSDRNIVLTAADHARIAESTDAASAKGSREALLLLDRLALIVGVPNRTVITVIEPDEGENTVFTHIDSVVIVGRESK